MKFKTILITFAAIQMAHSIALAQTDTKTKPALKRVQAPAPGSINVRANEVAGVLGLREPVIKDKGKLADKGNGAEAETGQPVVVNSDDKGNKTKGPTADAATTLLVVDKNTVDGIKITQPKDDVPAEVKIVKLTIWDSQVSFQGLHPKPTTAGQLTNRLTLEKKDKVTVVRYYNAIGVEFQIEALEGTSLFDKMMSYASYYQHSVSVDKCPLTLKIATTSPLKLLEINYSCKPQIFNPPEQSKKVAEAPLDPRQTPSTPPTPSTPSATAAVTPVSPTFTETLDGVKVTQPKDDKPVEVTIEKLIISGAGHLVTFQSKHPVTAGQFVDRLSLEKKDGKTIIRYFNYSRVEFAMEQLVAANIIERMIKDANFYQYSVSAEKCPLTLKIESTIPMKLLEIIYSCKPQIAIAPLQPHFG